MQWDDLKYVLAVSRSGSFLGAAALMKVTHTTVGRRIHALERDLGRRLFEVSRDGCTPTALCRTLIPRAEAMEAEVRSIDLGGAALPEPATGTVRLHTAAWLMRAVLIPRLPALHAKHPGLRPFFVGDVVDSVPDTSGPGLSLRFDVLARRTEVEADLVQIPFSFYARSDLDPGKLPYVSNHGGQVSLKTYGWLTAQGIEDEAIVALGNDADLVHAAIRAGTGKGLIPEHLGEADPHLVRLSRDAPDFTRILRSLTPHAHIDDPAVTALTDWLRDCLLGHFDPASGGTKRKGRKAGRG